ncbi:AIP3-domain-containing protein, partial [Saccharata proteae CBS 121410]
PQQQLSQIEKSVTHLLVATKQLLETLTLWSRGTATEGEVSDVYVRLGYEFNIASRAFNAIGVDTQDLGNVPDLLRSILEETLSQEASQASLDRFLPRIRDIIINLLHGLKKKQQRLRQRSGSSGSNGGKHASQGSQGEEEAPSRHSSSRQSNQRHGSNDIARDQPDLPPRTTSVGRSSPSKYDSVQSNPRITRTTGSHTSRDNSDSSLSSNAMQNIPVIAPYPHEDAMPSQPENPPPAYAAQFPPPPPPPPKQDALEKLQREGALERRASRRFSAYQIQKHLNLSGSNNGISMIPPSQNSPIPNRGRDARESMNAVRIRGSLLHSRDRSGQHIGAETSPVRSSTNLANRRISEESPQERDSYAGEKPLPQPQDEESPIAKTPDEMLAKPTPVELEGEIPAVSVTVSAPMDEAKTTEEFGKDQRSSLRRSNVVTPIRHAARESTSSPPQPREFVPDQSPQPGQELTLFLQYKSKIKKFTMADGFNNLSMARLQLAFIEKFAWNTHSNGADLPEIYIQDPISGVRHELEDINDIKDRSVLVLNVEALDEVKRHFDDGLGGLRTMIEGIKTSLVDQQSALQRVSDRQQDAAKEIASIAAAPPISSARVSMLPSSAPAFNAAALPAGLNDPTSQLTEVQSLRRDLAVVRQTYTSFVSDIEASMSGIRTKAASVKSTAVKASVPTLTGDTGRSYVNSGKSTLSDDSEKLVSRVDDLQDLVEDLRKDVVSRGVRPLPRQLETVAKDIQVATSEVKRLQDFLKKEKPVWTKIWEQELQMVMEDRDMLTMQEELALDLQDDLEKLAETFGLVEQATKQQNLSSSNSTNRAAVGRNMLRAVVDSDKPVDPMEAKDGVLGEVRALQPNHESRLEAIERAEKNRRRELESRRGGEFQKELGKFVEEGRLKKSGGVEEVERMRLVREERARKEFLEFMQQREREKQERMRAKLEAQQAEAEAEEEEDEDEEGEEEDEDEEEGEEGEEDE